MSILKKLFGGGDRGGDNAAASAASVEHEGHTIQPTPMKEGGQFRVAGTITKQVAGEAKTHQFIRADLFSAADECSEASIRKAKQLIDEQGDSIFR
jgi:hypothetical protein